MIVFSVKTFIFYLHNCIVKVFSSVLWCPLLFPHKHDVRFVMTPICFLGEGSCFIYVIVFIYIQCILESQHNFHTRWWPDGCHMWSRKCQPFWRTWVHPRCLVAFNVARFLVFCVMFCSSNVCSFVLFPLAFLLSVLLQFTASGELFGIFKLHISYLEIHCLLLDILIIFCYWLYP